MLGSDPATRRTRVLLTCAAVALLYAGVDAARWVPSYRAQARAAEVYQPVSVAVAEVERKRGSRSGRDRVIYTYTYEVDGQPYSSRRFSHLGEAPEGLYYERGQHYTAYFDPEDPREAVLSRERPQASALALRAGLPFLILGMVALGVWAMDRGEAQRAARKEPR
ncbi:MAG: DUF3592 domain-containing protein [Planctomycetota bacterium]